MVGISDMNEENPRIIFEPLWMIKRTCLDTNIWLYIVYGFLCFYLSAFATSSRLKLIVKILFDYLLERIIYVTFTATILTNMCLIEDGQGNIVMQIRDPKRYSWSVLPYLVSY